MHAADALLAAQNLGRQNTSLAVTLFRRFRPGDAGDDTSGKSLVGILSLYLPDAGVLLGTVWAERRRREWDARASVRRHPGPSAQ